jgi:hypothetical protein
MVKKFGVLFCLTLIGPLFAQQLKPVSLKAYDTPGDSGNSVYLQWPRMDYEDKDTEYIVFQASQAEPHLLWKEVKRFVSTEQLASETKGPSWVWNKDPNLHRVILEGQEYRPGLKFFFKVVTRKGAQSVQSNIVSISPNIQWFKTEKLNHLIFTIILLITILACIKIARGRELFLRAIPGLAALDEAVGRATEMGKPVYYLTGREELKKISTIAAVSILGEVVKKVAAYDTQIKVPHTDPMVAAVCQDVTRQAYIAAGRPDAYRDEINFFITRDQFSYTAAVDGMFLRERPAACIYMGYYYAESLILAETGASVGAIQIAGTDAEHQLPFFFTACDYTLIGEELYAAGAYLSKDPVLIGTIRGQDLCKFLIMLLLTAGVLLSTVAGIAGFAPLAEQILDAVRSF